MITTEGITCLGRYLDFNSWLGTLGSCQKKGNKQIASVTMHWTRLARYTMYDSIYMRQTKQIGYVRRRMSGYAYDYKSNALGVFNGIQG